MRLLEAIRDEAIANVRNPSITPTVPSINAARDTGIAKLKAEHLRLEREAAIKAVNDEYDRLTSTNNYSAAQLVQLAAARDNAINNINNAATVSGIHTGRDNGITAMRNVPHGGGGGDGDGDGDDDPGKGTGSGGGGGKLTEDDFSAGDAIVIVDGQPVNIGTVTDYDGTRTVTFNQEALNREIRDANDHVKVKLPADDFISSYEVVFVVQNVDDMAERNMILIIEIGALTYQMPSTAVDTKAIMDALGATNPADVPFTITIVKSVDAQTLKTVGDTLDSYGKEQMFIPIQFHITANYNGQSVSVTTFMEYVARTIEVTEDVARRITTGITICDEGKSRHVPTEVFGDSGKYYATINSLTNSTYVLIYYDTSFDDILDTWYAPCVDEKASRTIVKGRDDGLFYSKEDVSRAEFAAIIIRALGLPPDGDGSVFSDVSEKAWHSGYVGKAYEYGIILGVSGDLFEPDRNITRQEAMLMIQRAAVITGLAGNIGDISDFSDSADVSSWAVNAARWNVGSNLILGRSGMLHPADNITRAETATLVLRLLRNAGLIDEREGSQPDLHRNR